MNIEEGKFYFIKNDFFEKIDEKLLCLNKREKNKRPCYYCFRDKKEKSIYWLIPISSKVEKYQKIYNDKISRYGRVDNILFGYVEGEKRAFLIQNMFPILKKYITEKYVKQKRDVKVNDEFQKELKKKARKILKLVEEGYKNVVFPDILKIKEILILENKKII